MPFFCCYVVISMKFLFPYCGSDVDIHNSSINMITLASCSVVLTPVVVGGMYVHW